MPNSSAIRLSGRPLDCNNAMASRLNSSVKLRRGFVIKHPSCPFPERNKGVHQFGGGSALRPAVQRRVVDGNAPLAHHFLELAIADCRSGSTTEPPRE